MILFLYWALQLSPSGAAVTDGILEYTILSHTWGAEIEEVTFEDIINGTGEDKPGYEKIRLFRKSAACRRATPSTLGWLSGQRHVIRDLEDTAKRLQINGFVDACILLLCL